jgi:hypothetical protein
MHDLRHIPPLSIHLTPDDFEILTDSGRLLGPNSEFNRQQFTSMMLGELQRYSRRHIKSSVVLSENNVPMNEYSVVFVFQYAFCNHFQML